MLPNLGVNLSPLSADLLVPGAQLAESLGFESVWLGEHVAVPADFDQRYDDPQKPFTAASPFLEPFVALAHVAAATTTVRLGTGIVLLPLRDPIPVARSVVTLDVLSKGRLDFGVGVGWMPEEFAALGVDFATRGRRMDELLAALDVLYTADRPEYHGDLVDFPPIGFAPKPAGGRPRPRTLIGGYDRRALERAVKYDGWYGSVRKAPMAEHVAALHALRRERGVEDQPFEISAVHLGVPDSEALERFAKDGVDRLVVTPWQAAENVMTANGTATSLEPLEQYARRLGLA